MLSHCQESLIIVVKQVRPGSEVRCRHHKQVLFPPLHWCSGNRSRPHLRFLLTSSCHVPLATGSGTDKPCLVTASQNLGPEHDLHSTLDCYHQWADSTDSSLAVRCCSHHSIRRLDHTAAPVAAEYTEVAGAGNLDCIELDHGPRGHDPSSPCRSGDSGHDGDACGTKCNCIYLG